MIHTVKSSNVLRRHRLFISCFILAVLMYITMFSFPERASAADIEVNSLTDDLTGGCTLREAITAANDNMDFNDCTGTGAYGNDTITFSVTGTIALGSTLPNITDSAGLTIDGADQITISGNEMVQVMSVDSGAVLTLQNLTVANGSAGSGGGIFNSGTLTVTNNTFFGNSAGSLGGHLQHQHAHCKQQHFL